MKFNELTNEQRRQLIDAKQAFEAWRDAEKEFRHSYRGTMHWRTSKGKQYLGRKILQSWRSLGPRSPETERIKSEYTEQRTRLRRRATSMRRRVESMDRINRALGLGRMPGIAARVLRKLDEMDLLGNQLFVVGTHSLFAYEARSGVIFEGGLMETSDVDLLWDTRRKLSLAVSEEVRPEGILGLLRRVDRSFDSKPGHYRAVNDKGYFVDLIRPFEKNEATTKVTALADSDSDLKATAILGLQWLINAPKFEETVIGEDGRPLWISCIDPRAFTLHKWWVSKRPDRRALSRKRDAQQARAVYSVAADYLDLKFNAKDLTSLPIELVKGAKDLAHSTRKR